MEKDYDKLKSRYTKIENQDTEKNKVELLKEKILCTYAASIEESCQFTDSSFDNGQKQKLEPSDFRKFFNFKNIYAGRLLDDQNTGRTRNLSKNMIDLACRDDEWKSMIEELPDKILNDMKKQAREIIDIGPDFERRALRGPMTSMKWKEHN